MRRGRCHICSPWLRCGSPCASPCLRERGKTFHKPHSSFLSPSSVSPFHFSPQQTTMGLPPRQTLVPSSPRPLRISHQLSPLAVPHQKVAPCQGSGSALSLSRTSLMRSVLHFSAQVDPTLHFDPRCQSFHFPRPCQTRTSPA